MLKLHLKEAFQGMKEVATTETTFKIQLVIGLIAILTAIYFGFTPIEWTTLVIAITLVLSAEAFNTAIELFADHVTKMRHPEIKLIKDISASAVLITAIGSIIIGLILFLPKILILLK